MASKTRAWSAATSASKVHRFGAAAMKSRFSGRSLLVTILSLRATSVAGGGVDHALERLPGPPPAQVLGEQVECPRDGVGRAPRDVGAEAHPGVRVQRMA